MAVLWSPESGHVKELAKWEQRPTDQVSASMLQALGKPLTPPYQEFPKMLFKAAPHTGGPRISEHLTVHSAGEEARKLREGYALTQEDAIAAVDAHDRAIAQAAAERAYTDRRMGERAQAEARAADDATPAHVPSVAETSIKKRRPYVRKAKET